MKKIKLILPILLILILSLSCSQCICQEVISEDHTININFSNDYISVEESITLMGDSNKNYTTISFWIMDKSSDLKIQINDNNIENIKENENTYICNITSLNINMGSKVSINIKYNLETQEDGSFSKKVLRNTDEITLLYDGETIYSAIDLKENSKFDVKLNKPIEENLSIFTIIAIFLLAILLIVFTTYFFKKQKISRKKQASSDSEEYLVTKKSLLMGLLKDIEKKHRAKKISDETYHKLKDIYKNDAVDTMKKIEDIKEELE